MASVVLEHADQPGPQVHVIAGGGAGEVMMRALADAHIPFVAGALNIGDSDHTLALRLAHEVITEQPYAPISPEALQRVHTSLTHVSLLIICPVPIGPGNVALLHEAFAAAQRGLPVLLFVPGAENSLMEARDYTGGKGLRLMRELLLAGAVVVGSLPEAIEMTRRYISS